MPGLRNSGINTSAWYLAGYSGTELLVNDPKFIDPTAVFGAHLPTLVASLDTMNLVLTFGGAGIMRGWEYNVLGLSGLTGPTVVQNADLEISNALLVELGRAPVTGYYQTALETRLDNVSLWSGLRSRYTYTPEPGVTLVSATYTELTLTGSGPTTASTALGFPTAESIIIDLRGPTLDSTPDPELTLAESGTGNLDLLLSNGQTRRIQVTWSVNAPAVFP